MRHWVILVVAGACRRQFKRACRRLRRTGVQREHAGGANNSFAPAAATG